TFEYEGGTYAANDLLVDEEGNSHVLFYGENINTDAFGLLYATNAGGPWKTRDVDTAVEVSRVSLFSVAPNVFGAGYFRGRIGWGTYLTQFPGGSDMP
ncbi:MAG: hypothetical protein M5R36_04485, partial [Deltaproteobacteria bacterium]|nr:hypothetical protein [Deltaproteobacteria bacterium]